MIHVIVFCIVTFNYILYFRVVVKKKNFGKEKKEIKKKEHILKSKTNRMLIKKFLELKIILKNACMEILEARG